ncbi:MAG: flagellar motor switch phosphatase FliY [Lachnospiraceae bacterium]|nr:flagellar motor switch phosphatase FliY [Lachnospiraceae bacterium]
MSDTTLSQEEINALIAGGIPGGDAANTVAAAQQGANGGTLSSDEIDTIGEIANISMGSAATALFSLVNRKVEISTPIVSVSNWDEIVGLYEKPCVLIKISYTRGIDGSNLLILKEDDVKVITNLMMGGDGTNVDDELGEIHLSAISEAMNQMMGSSATSLSSMLNETVDISPPTSDLIDLQDTATLDGIGEFIKGDFVKVQFRLLVGDLVDSIMMQLYPIDLAKSMVESIKKNMQTDSNSTVDDAAFGETANDYAQPVAPAQMEANPIEAQQPQPAPQPMMQGQPMMQQPMYAQPPMGYAPQPMPMQQPVNVQPAQFSTFEGAFPATYSSENIDLIMDVPLEVTVELGRTHKSIKDILEFAPGTIIELNKIAGEPIDVLVNGKYVAKGEVVVIEESFGIRITEIVK